LQRSRCVKRVQIAVAIAALLVLAGLLGLQRMRQYVETDPRFCASCHMQSPEFALWTSGSHKAVACQKCHHSTPEESVQMLRSFLAGASPDTNRSTHAKIEIGSCAGCHLSHDREWVQVGASRGHRIHAIEQKISCITCHGAGVHRFEPIAATCKSCHSAQSVRAPGMQQVHCFACHDFLSAGSDLRPTRRDCLKCHQEQGLHPARFPDKGPMQFACGSCHRPHAEPGKDVVACVSCHANLAGLHQNAAHRDCARCHRPHGWNSEVADCLRCHKEAASHDVTLTCRSCHRWRASP
jgi:hypothetical protein